MAALPPPEGMTEDDYDQIHAAVVETVRGRWFLAEYARRGRVEEVQEMLAAIGRLETAVTGQRTLPPPVETAPHARLLVQRADEIATRLAGLVEDLRDSGADAYLCDDLESQMRAIAALSKGQPEMTQAAPARVLATDVRPALALPREASKEPDAGMFMQSSQEPLEKAPQGMPETVLPALTLPPAPTLPRVTAQQVSRQAEDLRLAALAAIDRLPLTDKLALFS
jgi:hypothetical protein